MGRTAAEQQVVDRYVIETIVNLKYPAKLKKTGSNIKMDAIPEDTTVEAAAKQFEILRRLGPEARLRMAFEMSDNLRSIVESGVRGRNPDYNEQKIKQEILRLMIGEALFKQIYPDIETQI